MILTTWTHKKGQGMKLQYCFIVRILGGRYLTLFD